jgi:hypothetical protein
VVPGQPAVGQPGAVGGVFEVLREAVREPVKPWGQTSGLSILTPANGWTKAERTGPPRLDRPEVCPHVRSDRAVASCHIRAGRR